MKISTGLFVIFVSLLAAEKSHCADPRRINRLVNGFSQDRTINQRDLPSKQTDGSEQKKFFGSNAQVEDYDATEFSEYSGGPVKWVGQLNTEFKSSACWTIPTHESMTSGRADGLKWRRVSGKLDKKKMQLYFNTPSGPDDSSLAVYSSFKRRPEEAAYFESCSISCSSSPIKVTLKYWASDNVVLEVCYRRAFFNEGGPADCKRLPAGGQPGPMSITLIPDEQFTAIVIKASNFVDSRGSVAIIDDLTVDYALCDLDSGAAAGTDMPTRRPLFTRPGVFIGGLEEATARTPVPPTPAAETARTCRNAECPFERDLCSYRDVQPRAADGSATYQRMTIQRGRFRNQLTGIRRSPDGKQYAAAYLSRNEMAGLESGPVDVTEDRVVQMDLFEATQGIKTKICFNNPNTCPYKTRGVLQRDEREWKTMSWVVPKGTKKVILITENQGNNEGAVGYSNLRLLNLGPGGSFSADRPSCPNSGARFRRTQSRLR